MRKKEDPGPIHLVTIHVILGRKDLVNSSQNTFDFQSKTNYVKHFLVKLITLWKQYEWIPHKKSGYIKALWNCFEWGDKIFELSPDVCFIRIISVNINIL